MSMIIKTFLFYLFIVHKVDVLSIGLLVLGFIGGITVSFTIVYLVYCYNEAQRKEKREGET